MQTKERVMSDYYEYYYMNPHEVPPMDDQEHQEMLDEAMLNKIDETPAADFIDYAYDYDLEATNSVIKAIAVAYYFGKHDQLETLAKSLGKIMITSMENFVEENL